MCVIERAVSDIWGVMCVIERAVSDVLDDREPLDVHEVLAL